MTLIGGDRLFTRKILGRYLYNQPMYNVKFIAMGVVTQWQSARFACEKSRVQSSATPFWQGNDTI